MGNCKRMKVMCENASSPVKRSYFRRTGWYDFIVHRMMEVWLRKLLRMVSVLPVFSQSSSVDAGNFGGKESVAIKIICEIQPYVQNPTGSVRRRVLGVGQFNSDD